MGEKILISIILPTYNHAHFLGRALDSIKSQHYSNWEVLIVDNHSTDDTDSVILIKKSKISYRKLNK